MNKLHSEEALSVFSGEEFVIKDTCCPVFLGVEVTVRDRTYHNRSITCYAISLYEGKIASNVTAKISSWSNGNIRSELAKWSQIHSVQR